MGTKQQSGGNMAVFVAHLNDGGGDVDPLHFVGAEDDAKEYCSTELDTSAVEKKFLGVADFEELETANKKQLDGSDDGCCVFDLLARGERMRSAQVLRFVHALGFDEIDESDPEWS